MIYFFLILLTIFFSSRADLMYENITGVLIQPEYRLLTMIYIIFLAWFYGIKVYRIYKNINIQRIYKYTIFLTSLIMSIGAITPYTLNSNDFLSNIHVYSSILSSLSFLIHLFIYFYYLKSINYNKYHKIFPYYLKGIEFLIILTIVFGRMNGYIEIIYSIIVSLTLLYLEKK